MSRRRSHRLRLPQDEADSALRRPVEQGEKGRVAQGLLMRSVANGLLREVIGQLGPGPAEERHDHDDPADALDLGDLLQMPRYLWARDNQTLSSCRVVDDLRRKSKIITPSSKKDQCPYLDKL